jgi:hypothetical protein
MSGRPTRKLRCAVYTRKSSEEGLEQEFNSLAAGLDRGAPSDVQLAKLEAVLTRSSERLDEVVPLMAALLGVPTGERYLALTLTSRKREKTPSERVIQVNSSRRKSLLSQPL